MLESRKPGLSQEAELEAGAAIGLKGTAVAS